MNKFEQLIEYVINDDEAKAKELFHEIVVEKSRGIWENLMTEEELDEESHDEKADDRAERDAEKVKKDLEYDYKHGRKVKEDEELDEMAMGGDAADDLIDDVEMEEEGMTMEDDAEFDDEAEEAGDDLTKDMEADHDEDRDEAELEDRVVDLEDKLDELMAEFEGMMGGDSDTSDMGSDDMGDGDDFGPEEGGDAIEMDDTEEMMSENVTLDKAPAPKTSEESFVNKKSTVAANSGKAGMEGAPVKMTGDTAQGRSAPGTKDLPDAGKFKNVPGKGGSNAKLDAAPRPVTSQATGVNTKTPFPKG